MKQFLTVLLLLALALTTCDDKQDTHTHTWSDWQSNAEQHWKECSCGEKTDIGNHTENPCTVCGYETKHEPQPKIIDNTNGLDFTGKVIIKTSDLYTGADWNAVVQKVIAALNRGYAKFNTVGGFEDASNKSNFENALHSTYVSAEIIISSSANKKIEVLSTDYEKMYLNPSVINDTLDLQPAIKAMAQMDGGYELQ
jgi:hypothetical protein